MGLLSSPLALHLRGSSRGQLIRFVDDVVLSSFSLLCAFAFGGTKGPSRATVLWTPRALCFVISGRCARPTVRNVRRLRWCVTSSSTETPPATAAVDALGVRASWCAQHRCACTGASGRDARVRHRDVVAGLRRRRGARRARCLRPLQAHRSSRIRRPEATFVDDDVRRGRTRQPMRSEHARSTTRHPRARSRDGFRLPLQ